MATQLTTTEYKAPAKAPVTAGKALAAFVPQTMEEAWRLSGAIAASGMTPKTYGSDQNKVMVGIMAGAELGLTPFAALQSIAVINGNPSLWGDGMLGLVEASGLLEDFEETDDGKVATCRAVRKGRATPIVRTFSVEDAKTAQLGGKAGPWQQYPKRMRQLRARAFALRDGFSDVLKGVKSAEEVRDYAPMDGGTLASGPQVVTAALIEQQAIEEPQDDFREGRPDTEMGEAHVEHDAETGELFEAPQPTKTQRQIANTIIAGLRAASGNPDTIGEIMEAQLSAISDWPRGLKLEVYDARDEALGRGGK